MELKLIVDGKDIPMNRFVEKMVEGVVAGTVQSLDGVDKNWKELTLTIGR
ncbi:MAG: hypothetical protein M8353_05360 [ANME-2 cluster archaeon]|nr:hypothetical protein [ANME-2 cluster archaeon]